MIFGTRDAVFRHPEKPAKNKQATKSQGDYIFAKARDIYYICAGNCLAGLNDICFMSAAKICIHFEVKISILFSGTNSVKTTPAIGHEEGFCEFA